MQEAFITRARENHEFIDELKTASCCLYCGERDTTKLQFHHRDPDDVEFYIGSSKGRNLDRLIAEIEKCDIVCTSCHQDIHNGALWEIGEN